MDPGPRKGIGTMTLERVIRLVVIVSLMNIATTSYLLLGRPDLAVREGAENIYNAAAQLEQEGKFEEAARLYEKVFYDMSVSLVAPKAGQRLADIYRRRLYDVEKARRVLVEAAAFKESVFAEEAARDLQFMEANWDGDGETLKLWYQASNTFRGGKKQEALDILNRIVTERPQAALRPTAMLRAAKIAKELGNNQQAGTYLRDFLAAYPKDTGVAEARELLGKIR